MAPPKTMVISQQQQQQQHQQILGHQQQGNQQQAGKQGKPKKRKANSAKQQAANQPLENNKPQIDSNESQDISIPNDDKENIAPSSNKVNVVKQHPVVPSERTTTKNQTQQVPTPAKENKTEAVSAPTPILTPETVIKKQQQISNEEADDIDAGIELDGSSNSGSSVKDMNEDQIKSASVSPVMAQSNLVNEACIVNQAQPVVEAAPVEQIASALCSSTSSPKKISTTKQQLAANQEVIDADEQLLQAKLQNKQRKCSEDNLPGQPSKNDKAATPVRRRFSSQSSLESQDGALCKVCEQHVYQMERMLAEKAIYHKRCFRCFQCKIQLRVDNYSSHEGQVYCKAHHRQIFQPQVKLDSTDDVDIVTQSTSQIANDYLSQRGRLSELSYSFLQQNPEEIRQRQLIICENEPAELPKDVVRSDTKLDDGIEQLNLNLNNILEKFERGTASNGEESQPTSAGVVIEKPSFNIKQTLMAFETRMANQAHEDSEELKRSERATERPVVRKLNLNGFLHRQNSIDTEATTAPAKPLAVRRSESLMQRLKKYELRIAGEQVDDDSSDSDENDGNNNNINGVAEKPARAPKKLTSLRNQWENGDINKKRFEMDEDGADNSGLVESNCKGNSAASELQLARKKSTGTVKNIQQLLQNGASIDSQQTTTTPTTPNKDHFQLNLSKKANKLKEKFELGLITNSHDDSDLDDCDDAPALTKLEQIRQEKLEDLSIFTEGEGVKTREARNIFQQIDRRISAASGGGQQPNMNSKSLASIGASMRSKLTKEKGLPAEQMNNPSPIRLSNNVRT